MCFNSDEYTFKNLEEAKEAKLYCANCNAELVREFPAPGTFEIRGYSYKNGYASK